MPTLSIELDRFIRFSTFTVREEHRDVIVGKPLDPTVQEEMMQEARLAGIADEETTIDTLYALFGESGFKEEIIEETSSRRPMLVRERKDQ